MNALPHNVEFNGPQNVGSKTLLMFTDLVTEGTFTVEARHSDHSGILSALTILRKRLQYHEPATSNHDHPPAS